MEVNNIDENNPLTLKETKKNVISSQKNKHTKNSEKKL
jgi:hypothetical protein